MFFGLVAVSLLPRPAEQEPHGSKARLVGVFASSQGRQYDADFLASRKAIALQPQDLGLRSLECVNGTQYFAGSHLMPEPLFPDLDEYTDVTGDNRHTVEIGHGDVVCHLLYS